MSLLDEFESTTKEIDESTDRLKALDPNHELLSYWFRDPDSAEGQAKAVEMKTRFWQRREPQSHFHRSDVVVMVMGNYAIALKAAIAALEGKTSGASSAV